MATKSGRICDICEALHLTNEAEIWCPQCEEALWLKKQNKWFGNNNRGAANIAQCTVNRVA